MRFIPPLTVGAEIFTPRPAGLPPGLPYPQPRDKPIRFRAAAMKPGEDSDQTGFALPRRRRSRRRTPGRANGSATTMPSRLPPTPSRSSGQMEPVSGRPTTTSFKPTRRLAPNEAPLLDCGRRRSVSSQREYRRWPPNMSPRGATIGSFVEFLSGYLGCPLCAPLNGRADGRVGELQRAAAVCNRPPRLKPLPDPIPPENPLSWQ